MLHHPRRKAGEVSGAPFTLAVEVLDPDVLVAGDEHLKLREAETAFPVSVLGGRYLGDPGIEELFKLQGLPVLGRLDTREEDPPANEDLRRRQADAAGLPQGRAHRLQERL